MGDGQEQQFKEGRRKGGHGGGNTFHHKKPNIKFFQGDRGTKRGGPGNRGGHAGGGGGGGGGEGPANKVRPYNSLHYRTPQ